MQGAQQEQVLVLIGRDYSTLKINHESVGGQEVHPEDGLHVCHLEVPNEAAALELEWNHPRAIAVNAGCSGPYQVVSRGGELAGDQAAKG